MVSVKDACCKFLMKQLHPANCLGIRRFADTHSCEDLLSLSHSFALQNFVDVCDTEEFLLLSFKDVSKTYPTPNTTFFYVLNEVGAGTQI